MNKFVIDASVALKWFPFGDEKLITEARDVWEAIKLKKIQAYAPVFMLVEVANVLIKKKKVDLGIVIEILKRIDNSEINFIDLEKKQISHLVKLMDQTDLTAYDAQYVLLGKKLKSKVLSVDGPMLQLKKDCIGLDAWK